jgi:hypothetical protein
MRCPKCGRIGFDYLENCSNCGQDLREVSAGLGGFAKPNPELIWLSEDSKTEPEAPFVEQEAGNSKDLSEIDVSDLMDVSGGGLDTDLERIDPSELETVADDEVFQQALDNVLKNK